VLFTTRLKRKGSRPRPKESLKFIKNQTRHSSTLTRRKNTLLAYGFKLHVMTGAEVLVIVQTDRERKICASDLLKNQYESGKLAPTGTKEFANVTKTIKPEDGESLGVAPLEDTPKKLPLDENMSELFGLNIHGRAANQNVIVKQSIQEVLFRRPLPNLTEQEKALCTPQPSQVAMSFISDESMTVVINAPQRE